MQTLVETWSGAHYHAFLRGAVPQNGGRRRGTSRPCSDFDQEKNDRTSQAKLLQLMEANFTLQDLFVTLTYSDDALPINYEAAKKRMQAFARKYRETRKRLGLDYRYIYVIEGLHGDHRIHHHLLTCAADGAEEMLKALWKHGGVHVETIRSFAEKKQTLDDCTWQCGGDARIGRARFVSACYAIVAKYMTKEPRKTGRLAVGRPVYYPSRSLQQPQRILTDLDAAHQISVPPGFVELGSGRIDDIYGSRFFVDGWDENRISI